MEIPRIQNVNVTGEHTLIVGFSNGKRKLYDISSLLEKEMFAPLKLPAFLKNVQIEQGGYALIWNKDIDISEYELWKNGVDF
ncbi:MAG: hypothetical protein HW421_3690 [Ignavibacteria bacterium]|nr:hypothetical protein [Ignavibacteria bacterium]